MLESSTSIVEALTLLASKRITIEQYLRWDAGRSIARLPAVRAYRCRRCHVILGESDIARPSDLPRCPEGHETEFVPRIGERELEELLVEMGLASPPHDVHPDLSPRYPRIIPPKKSIRFPVYFLVRCVSTPTWKIDEILTVESNGVQGIAVFSSRLLVEAWREAKDGFQPMALLEPDCLKGLLSVLAAHGHQWIVWDAPGVGPFHEQRTPIDEVI